MSIRLSLSRIGARLAAVACTVSLIHAGGLGAAPLPDAATRVLHPRIGITGLKAPVANETRLNTYVGALKAAGAEPVLLYYGDTVSAADLDGIVFAGGEDVDPAYYGEKALPNVEINADRDRSEMAQATSAFAQSMPILGICRGSQLLNVKLGGSLVQDIPSQVTKPLTHGHGAMHTVTVLAGTHLAEIVGTAVLPVNSYHHQAVKELASGLQVTARSEDGVIEAWEARPIGPRPNFLAGVQFHPEKPDFPSQAVSKRLFADFIKAAGRFAARRAEKPAAAPH